MTAEHRCDPQLLNGSGGGPLTLSRTLRLVLAVLDDRSEGGENADVIAMEIAGCFACSWSVAMGAAGAAAAFLHTLDQRRDGLSPRPQLELALQTALDQLAREDGAR